jgi:uncharacterized protein YecT (DUF1311 family)
MRAIVYRLPALILLTSCSALAQNDDKCYDGAKTQSEINACASGAYARADRKLNEVYEAILRRYSEDATFLGKLREAQRSWLKFRDAELQALYPEDDKLANYGSVWPMCSSQHLTSLTEDRIKQLETWLDSSNEEDVCAGSRRGASLKPKERR